MQFVLCNIFEHLNRVFFLLLFVSKKTISGPDVQLQKKSPKYSYFDASALILFLNCVYRFHSAIKDFNFSTFYFINFLKTFFLRFTKGIYSKIFIFTLAFFNTQPNMNGTTEYRQDCSNTFKPSVVSDVQLFRNNNLCKQHQNHYFDHKKSKFLANQPLLIKINSQHS